MTLAKRFCVFLRVISTGSVCLAPLLALLLRVISTVLAPGFLTILPQAGRSLCLPACCGQWLMQHEQLFVADARRKEMAIASLASRLLFDWLTHGLAPFVCPGAVTLVGLVILLWGRDRREMMRGTSHDNGSCRPTGPFTYLLSLQAGRHG